MADITRPENLQNVRPLSAAEAVEFAKQWLGGQWESLPVFERTLTSANVPVRQYLADIVTLAVQRRTPVRNLLRRVRAPGGYQFEWFLVTNTVAPTSAVFPEGSAPSVGEPAYSRPPRAVAFKPIALRAEITAQAQLVSANFHHQVAAAIEYLTIQVARAEEWMLLKGDSSVNPNQIDGLLKQITTNSINKNGNALQWADIVEACRAIWQAGGTPKYLVCGPREALTISQLYLNVVRPRDMGTVPYGAFVNHIITPYGEMDVIISPDLAPETRTIGGSPVQASDIVILDTDQPVAGGAGVMPGTAIEVHELLPMEAWIFPMQSTLTTPVVVWENIALAVRAENFQAKIINIGPSS
jgi:hypothetical protein